MSKLLTADKRLATCNFIIDFIIKNTSKAPEFFYSTLTDKVLITMKKTIKKEHPNLKKTEKQPEQQAGSYEEQIDEDEDQPNDEELAEQDEEQPQQPEKKNKKQKKTKKNIYIDEESEEQKTTEEQKSVDEDSLVSRNEEAEKKETTTEEEVEEPPERLTMFDEPVKKQKSIESIMKWWKGKVLPVTSFDKEADFRVKLNMNSFKNQGSDKMVIQIKKDYTKFLNSESLSLRNAIIIGRKLKHLKDSLVCVKLDDYLKQNGLSVRVMKEKMRLYDYLGSHKKFYRLAIGYTTVIRLLPRIRTHLTDNQEEDDFWRND